MTESLGDGHSGYAVVLAKLDEVKRLLDGVSRVVHGPNDDALRLAAADRLLIGVVQLKQELDGYLKRRVKDRLDEVMRGEVEER